jgi:hypothetical protein
MVVKQLLKNAGLAMRNGVLTSAAGDLKMTGSMLIVARLWRVMLAAR